MREIRFRAWNVVTKTMIDLKKATPLALAMDTDGLFIPFSDGLVLMQFTGLCDKKGKEIYEGDICENQYGWIGTIIWDSDIPLGGTVPFTGWWWKCKEEREGKFPFNVDKKTKIIGNVFQNKDLLKEKP